jgi:hypothetical protein
VRANLPDYFWERNRTGSDTPRKIVSRAAAHARRAQAGVAGDSAKVGCNVAGIQTGAAAEPEAIDCSVCHRSLAPKKGKGGKFVVYHCPSVGKKHFTAFVAVAGTALNAEARGVDAEASDLLERLNALVEKGKA